MDNLWMNTGLPLISDTLPQTEAVWSGMAPTIIYQAETPPEDILSQMVIGALFAWMTHAVSSTVPPKAQEA